MVSGLTGRTTVVPVQQDPEAANRATSSRSAGAAATSLPLTATPRTPRPSAVLAYAQGNKSTPHTVESDAVPSHLREPDAVDTFFQASQDPERPVAVGVGEEDDGWNGLLADGEGEEWDHGGEADEDDEDEDEEEEEGGNASNKSRRPRYRLPSWLKESFDSKVAACAKRDHSGLPPLYATHGTFWFPRPSAFFTMMKKRKIEPQDL